jgi:phage shock protein A
LRLQPQNLTDDKKDDIDRELAKISNKNSVDTELERLKNEMKKN